MGTRKSLKKSRPQQKKESLLAKALGKVTTFFANLTSALLQKIIIGIILFFLSMWVVDRYYYNPEKDLPISGYVGDYDTLKQLEDVTVGVEGYNLVMTTDENGFFSGIITVRKNDERIELVYSKEGYRIENKAFEIPLDKKPIQGSQINLKPNPAPPKVNQTLGVVFPH